MQRWLRDQSSRILGRLIRPFYGGVGSVMCFHRVVPKDDRSANVENRSMEMTPGGLRAILDWVRRRGIEVIRLDEVRQRLASPRTPKFIVFTFDDGYRDNLTEALPIFRDFGMPFTINVTTGFINRTASVWWYSLEDAMAGRPKLDFTWDGTRCTYQIDTPGQRERTYIEVAGLIRAQGRATRDELVATICAGAGIDPLARTRELMLTWDEIKKMTDDWHVNIGSHTVGHHNLNHLTEEEVAAELIDARTELEAKLERPVRHLAYPFGGRNAVGRREFEIARAADFTTATTTRCGNLFHEHAWNLQALPRLGLSGNYPPLIRMRKLECGLIPAKENDWQRIVVE